MWALWSSFSYPFSQGLAEMNNETIILINEEDMKEGYFRFGTSIRHHIDKLIRVVTRKHLISYKENKDAKGRVVWWDVKVPVRFLSKGSFYIRRPVAGRQILTEQKRGVLRDRMKALRLQQLGTTPPDSRKSTIENK